MIRVLILVSATAGLTLGASGCSDSEDQLQRGCTVSCKKAVECAPGPVTEQICMSQCTSQTGTGSSGSECTPSSSEVDACISAVEKASCQLFLSGAGVPECNKLCNGGSTKQDSGGQADSGSSTGNCADLANCCPKLSGALKTSCDSTVQANIPAACSATLIGFRELGAC